MGSCLKASSSQAENAFSARTIYIKSKSESGKVTRDRVFFHLLPPILCEAYPFPMNSTTWQLSHCLVPGQDPRGQEDKICQDMLISQELGESFFCGVLDGHGKHGKPVVDYCRSFIQSKLGTVSDDSSLQAMLEKCEESLKTSEIDCSSSGTTAACVLITREHIYAAGVGDSRAVLARNNGASALLPMQLTTDHKPEHILERERITQAEGRVLRMLNDEDHAVGPYRVWLKSEDIPGLAMSRSIGDTIATGVGVISTPETDTVLLDSECEFVVIASDGVWEVLSNEEVINLVQTYRKQCRRKMSEFEGEVLNFSTTCIAHLLCEAARSKWLEIVAEEDNLIDDISCVIVEFN